MKKIIKTLLCIVLAMCMLFVVACNGSDSNGVTPPTGNVGGDDSGGDDNGGNEDLPDPVVKPTAAKLIAGGKEALDKGELTVTFEISDDDSAKFVLDVINGDDGYIDSFKLTGIETTYETEESSEPIVKTQVFYIYGNDTLYKFKDKDVEGKEYFTATTLDEKFKVSKLVDYFAEDDAELIENEDGGYTVKSEEDLTNKVNMYYKLVSGNLDKTFQQMFDILLGGDGVELTEYNAVLNQFALVFSVLYNNSMNAVISMIDAKLSESELTVQAVIDMIPNAYKFLNTKLGFKEAVIIDYASFIENVSEMTFHTFVEKLLNMSPLETQEDFKNAIIMMIDEAINTVTYGGSVGETIRFYCEKYYKNYYNYLLKMIEFETKINAIKFGGEFMFDKDEQLTGFKFSSDLNIEKFPDYFMEAGENGVVGDFKPKDIDEHKFVSLNIDYTGSVDIVLPGEDQIITNPNPPPNPDNPNPTEPVLPDQASAAKAMKVFQNKFLFDII